ncbi:MAG: cytochrome b5-like heme/steroid binding domain-containing protein [Patescibacteria group bacterium]
MATVSTHNSETSCWTAINGSVYELTEWIGRHPGGPGNIKKLCGIDGTTLFTNKHGSSSNAQSALVLLKIGALAE